MADNSKAAPPSKPTSTKTNRKRPSPFRIKVGSVVALRMQPTGNSISIVSDDDSTIIQPIDFSGYSYVWTAPYPGRDQGLGLLGKCIRLFLPKAVVADPKRRVLEGQVVGVHHAKPTKIHLLVDKSHADAFPFIHRVPLEPAPADNASNSKSARRHALLEERIRGADKVLLQIKLSMPGPAAKVDDKKTKFIQWAILKLVPNKLLLGDGSTAERRMSLDNPSTKQLTAKAPKLAVKHVGDGTDSAEQQVSNWRWLASRYHDRLFHSIWPEAVTQARGNEDKSSSTAADSMLHFTHLLSAGFVGVVKEVNALGASSGSLASVKLERLILPQHTASARHEPLQIYQDYDNSGYMLQIPIEQLVVIAKSLERQQTMMTLATHEPTSGDDGYLLDQLVMPQSYSLRRDSYLPLAGVSITETDAFDPDRPPCHRCRKALDNLQECSSAGCCLAGPHGNGTTAWCSDCLTELCHAFPQEKQFPCCLGRCDCRRCESFVGSNLQDDLYEAVSSVRKNVPKRKKDSDSAFYVPFMTTKLIGTIDFGLPRSMLDANDHPKPMAQPSTRVKPLTSKRLRIYNEPDRSKAAVSKSSKPGSKKKRQRLAPAVEHYGTFEPTCARHCDVHEGARRSNALMQSQLTLRSSSVDRPRNLRELLKEKKWGDLVEKDEKLDAGGRAARANQRRFMKDVSLLGANAFTIDSLATRESQIRFDRSGIHSWGVFADAEIAADEMIIEYKGVLISNAVAEKREKVYEQEKIGSDYMFRIDSLTVCDATKEGNVARFINASCDPNCYTKIITIDGSKRIVIYSKRGIMAGEELTYDYKFPLEYDSAKRISCHCGAKDCRGFMNWDKKFVAVESPDKRKSDGSILEDDSGLTVDVDDSVDGTIDSRAESRQTLTNGSMPGISSLDLVGDASSNIEDSKDSNQSREFALNKISGSSVSGILPPTADNEHGSYPLHVDVDQSVDYVEEDWSVDEHPHPTSSTLQVYSGRVKRSCDDLEACSDDSCASLSSSPPATSPSDHIGLLHNFPVKRIKRNGNVSQSLPALTDLAASTGIENP